MYRSGLTEVTGVFLPDAQEEKSWIYTEIHINSMKTLFLLTSTCLEYAP